MNKQILFVALVGVGAISCLAAKQDAFKINIFESDHRWDAKQGIPSTDKLNGIRVWDILESEKPMNPEGISVTKYSAEGMLSDAKELSQFSQRTLDLCRFHIMLHGEEFARNKYDADSVSLIKSLMDRTCYLCVDGDQQVMVTHAQGTPQDVCDMLRPSIQKIREEKQRLQAFDEKYKNNIRRTWKQAEKQREASGK